MAIHVIELTEEEIQALAQLMDAGVRAQGLGSVQNAAVLIQKIEASEPKLEESPEEDPPED